MLVRVRNPCGFPVPSQGKTAAHPSHLPSSDIQPYKQEGDVQTMKRFFLKPFFPRKFYFFIFSSWVHNDFQSSTHKHKIERAWILEVIRELLNQA
jgi:hypothetical protein